MQYNNYIINKIILILYKLHKYIFIYIIEFKKNLLVVQIFQKIFINLY